jgi:hypothetical protein
MADWPISKKTIGDDYLSDDEARCRHQDEYAATLLDRARRVANDDGLVSQTPQEAALELIGMAEEALASPECRIPEPVRIYLHKSLQSILDGKDADVAMGIRATKGRRPLDDATVSTILAHVALGMRRGLLLSEAKAKTLHEVDELWDGGRTQDWLDDLLGKHRDKVQALSLVSDADLAGMADFEYLKQQKESNRVI